MERQRMASSSRLMVCSGGVASWEGASSASSSASAPWTGSRPCRRKVPLMRFRAIPQSQERNFSGSRRPASCFHAATKVSWARSSLWLKLPVALYANEQINDWYRATIWPNASRLPARLSPTRSASLSVETDIGLVVIILPHRWSASAESDKVFLTAQILLAVELFLECRIVGEFGQAELPGGLGLVRLAHFLVLVAQYEVRLGECRRRSHRFLLVDQAGQPLDNVVVASRIRRPVIHGGGLDEICLPILRINLQRGIETLIGLHG